MTAITSGDRHRGAGPAAPGVESPTWCDSGRRSSSTGHRVILASSAQGPTTRAISSPVLTDRSSYPERRWSMPRSSCPPMAERVASGTHRPPRRPLRFAGSAAAPQPSGSSTVAQG